MTFDPDYMTNNPSFELLSGIPDEVKANAEAFGTLDVHPGEASVRRGAPKPEYNIPQQPVVYDDGFDPLAVQPAHAAPNTEVSFQSYDDGAQTITGTPVENINVPLPNSVAPVPVAAQPAPIMPSPTAPPVAQDLSGNHAPALPPANAQVIAQDLSSQAPAPAPAPIPPTPPGVPPAVSTVGENRPAPVLPPTAPPVAPQLPATPPPVAPVLGSSLPPAPMTVPTVAPTAPTT